jgi:phage terminase small subunit
MPPGGRRVGSGRKAKPIERKVLEGSFRKDRHGGAPAVSGGFPKAPRHLSAAERRLWKAFPHPAWIGETDVVAVTAAVSTYARILKNHKAQHASEEAGAPLVGDDGHENPLITQEIKLWGRLMSILGTLGLTPADRAKMQAPRVNETAEAKWAGLL